MRKLVLKEYLLFVTLLLLHFTWISCRKTKKFLFTYNSQTPPLLSSCIEKKTQGFQIKLSFNLSLGKRDKYRCWTESYDLILSQTWGMSFWETPPFSGHKAKNSSGMHWHFALHCSSMLRQSLACLLEAISFINA